MRVLRKIGDQSAWGKVRVAWEPGAEIDVSTAALAFFMPGPGERSRISVYLEDASTTPSHIASAMSLAAGYASIATVFAVADLDELKNLGCVVHKTKGKTKFEDVDEIHRDIEMPTTAIAIKACEAFLRNEEIELSANDVRNCIKGAVASGDWKFDPKTVTAKAWEGAGKLIGDGHLLVVAAQ